MSWFSKFKAHGFSAQCFSIEFLQIQNNEKTWSNYIFHRVFWHWIPNFKNNFIFQGFLLSTAVILKLCAARGTILCREDFENVPKNFNSTKVISDFSVFWTRKVLTNLPYQSHKVAVIINMTITTVDISRAIITCSISDFPRTVFVTDVKLTQEPYITWFVCVQRLQNVVFAFLEIMSSISRKFNRWAWWR